MEETEYILSGPEMKEELFMGSLAEYLIPKLKSLPEDRIIQIDEATGETITAHEFLKLSLEVAEGLIKLGLAKKDVVVLASPNNIRCHVTAAGIWFSGGILAPIDHNLRTFELKHLIQEFQPKFIITEHVKVRDFENIIKQLKLDAKIIVLNGKGFDSECLTWDDMRTEVNVKSYVPNKVDDPKKDILLISCSSGSSGISKGVAISHFSFLYNNTMIILRNNVLEKGVVFSSYLFWITGTTMFLATLSLGTLRVIPKSREIRHMLECIEKYKPSFHFFIPIAILQLLDILDTENGKYNLDSISEIFVGGSALGKSVIKKLKKYLKNVSVFQGYGMTEVTGSVAMPDYREFTGPPINPLEEDNVSESVGKLVPGVKIKVVDLKTGKSLGPNKIGECRVLSERIMVGYYNNEKGTQLAFDEKGWYKTGDLVYYDEEGRLYVCGRIKEIIKYRNYQVSPEEVETFIMDIPGVMDVAIIPVPHEMDTFHLKALVVKSPNSDLTEESIIQSVKENLSDPKHLRAGVQFVKSLPKTATGKTRRAEINNMCNTE